MRRSTHQIKQEGLNSPGPSSSRYGSKTVGLSQHQSGTRTRGRRDFHSPPTVRERRGKGNQGLGPVTQGRPLGPETTSHDDSVYTETREAQTGDRVGGNRDPGPRLGWEESHPDVLRPRREPTKHGEEPLKDGRTREEGWRDRTGGPNQCTYAPL